MQIDRESQCSSSDESSNETERGQSSSNSMFFLFCNLNIIAFFQMHSFKSWREMESRYWYFLLIFFW